MKQIMKKIYKVFLPTVLGLFLFSTVASAHVEVTPKTSTTGDEEVYTVRVPSEKDVPTTKITIKIPAGLDFDSVEPLAGWNFTTQKGSDGKVKSITFEATGQGILPEQFQRFVFIAVNPNKPTKAEWDAYQYYKDGSIVEWTGDEGSDSPHSITNIVSESKADQANILPAKTEVAKTATTITNTLPVILSVVAVLLSLVACVLSLRKR
ncbi:MAG: DUF1775 domain-containing protein [Bacillota bacterium]|nr:DUF1775 domain-containing protein [Bacillota bacterium]